MADLTCLGTCALSRQLKSCMMQQLNFGIRVSLQSTRPHSHSSSRFTRVRKRRRTNRQQLSVRAKDHTSGAVRTMARVLGVVLLGMAPGMVRVASLRKPDRNSMTYCLP